MDLSLTSKGNTGPVAECSYCHAEFALSADQAEDYTGDDEGPAVLCPLCEAGFRRSSCLGASAVRLNADLNAAGRGHLVRA